MKITKAEQLLDQFYFNSLDAPSNFQIFVHTMQLAGASRSPEAVQFEFAETDLDLDRIKQHRRTRQALLLLSPLQRYQLSYHYQEKCPHPQLRLLFKELSFLVNYFASTNEILSLIAKKDKAAITILLKQTKELKSQLLTAFGNAYEQI